MRYTLTGLVLLVVGIARAETTLGPSSRDLFVPSSVCAFSQDGRYLAVVGSAGSRGWQGRKLLLVRDLSTGKELMFHASEQEILAVAFSPSQPWLAYADGRGHITLWNHATRKVLTDLSEKTPCPVHAALFSPDGRYLVTLSQDSYAHWDLVTGLQARHGFSPGANARWIRDAQGVGILIGESHQVRLYSYAGEPLGPAIKSPGLQDYNDSRLAYAWYEKERGFIHIHFRGSELRSFHARTGKQIGSSRTLRNVREKPHPVYPDGKPILVHSYPPQEVEFKDEHAIPPRKLVWLDPKTEKTVRRYPLPDGSELVGIASTGSSFAILNDETGEMRVIRYEKDQSNEVLTLKPRSKAEAALPEHGSILAFADRATKTIEVWQAHPKKLLDTVTLKEEWKKVALSADGSHLAVYRTDEMVHVLNRGAKHWHQPFGPVKGGDYILGSATGNTWAFSDGKQIEVWSVEKGKRILTLPKSAYGPPPWALSGDGHWLATSDGPETLSLRDLRSGRCENIANASTIATIRFSPKGGTFATYSYSGMVCFWDAEPFRRRLCLFPEESLGSLHFTPDGEQLWARAYGLRIALDGPPTFEQRILTWSTKTGKRLSSRLLPFRDHERLLPCSDHEHFVLAKAEPVAHVLALSKLPVPKPVPPRDPQDILRSSKWGYEDPTLTLPVFSPDGKMVAVALETEEGEGVHLYDARTGRPLEKPSIRFPRSATALAFSPDSKQLAVATDTLIFIWDLTSGKRARMIDTNQHPIRALTYSPDGKRFAAAAGGSLLLWDSQGKLIMGLEGHRTEVTALRFSVDGKHFLSAGRAEAAGAPIGVPDSKFRQSGEVRRWDLEKKTSVVIGTLPSGQHVIPRRFSADGQLLLIRSTRQHGRHRREEQNLLDLRTKKVLAPIWPKGFVPMANTFLAMSPDGKSILRLMTGELQLQDVITGRSQPAGTIPFADGGITFSPDGKRIAYLVNLRSELDLFEREIYLLQTAPFPLPESGPNLDALALLLRSAEAQSKNGHPIAIGNKFGQVTYRDNEHKQHHSWRDHRSRITALAISQDGPYLASGDDEAVVVRETKSGKLRFRIPMGKEEGCAGISFAENDTELLIVTDQGELSRRSMTDGHELERQRITKRTVIAVRFSPDRQIIAVQPFDEEELLLRGFEPILWNWKQRKSTTFSLLKDERFDGLTQIEAHLDFSSDGKIILGSVTKHSIGIGLGGSSVTTTIPIEQCSGQAIPYDPHQLEPDASRRWTPLFPIASAEKDLQARWKILSDPQAARASVTAKAEMALTPEETLTFLRTNLPPMARIDSEKIRRLIQQLNHRSYRERQQASVALIEIEEQATPTLHAALKQRPTLEMRRRLEAILHQIESVPLSSQQVLAIRVTSMVESIGDEEAMKLLAHWADGAANARLTKEAKASLQRLKEMK